MAYEYCNVKMFPQNHEHNICTFSIVTQRYRGCKHVVNSLRICGIESVIEKTTGVDCERKKLEVKGLFKTQILGMRRGTVVRRRTRNREVRGSYPAAVANCNLSQIKICSPTTSKSPLI